MKTIYKYTIEATERQELDLPEGARILCVQEQYGQPRLWALLDTDAPLVTRKFILGGTGVPFDCSEAIYIGSYQLASGHFIGHLFEEV